MQRRSLHANDYRNVYFFCLVPFFLNDFLFYAVSETLHIYTVDYGTRIFVLCLIFAWPLSRMVALERIIPTWGAAAGIGCLIALPVIGIVMEKVVIFFMWPWASIDGIYDFNINAPTELYLIDLFGGLLLVAISEELVSRKLAWLWLSRIGLSATHICIISAFFLVPYTGSRFNYRSFCFFHRRSLHGRLHQTGKNLAFGRRTLSSQLLCLWPFRSLVTTPRCRGRL